MALLLKTTAPSLPIWFCSRKRVETQLLWKLCKPYSSLHPHGSISQPVLFTRIDPWQFPLDRDHPRSLQLAPSPTPLFILHLLSRVSSNTFFASFSRRSIEETSLTMGSTRFSWKMVDQPKLPKGKLLAMKGEGRRRGFA
ncbi:hypothetical protein L1987_34309 [Smallanthus sonchifolius]|uniref:Uncharacterized protein n=1 Tax=Smallanthus sonchifolius TaxID=185202 RepID=A0ACB9HUP8_9ASTR|nr:hypothetical protein L1987_34309 [Smallanthus sonchifolius]